MWYSNSCSVVHWPLWFGLLTPIAMMLVVHIILIVLCFLKILRYYSKASNHQVGKCVNSACASSYQRLLTTLTLKLICLFGGWSFCLLSISPHLSGSSQSLQALFAMFTFPQGILVFVYCVCSNSEAKNFWTLTNLKSCLKRGNHMSSRKRNHFTSFFHTLNKLMNCTVQKNVIPTNTNQAYHTVVLHNMKSRYSMTDNDAYSQGSRTRVIHTEWWQHALQSYFFLVSQCCVQ